MKLVRLLLFMLFPLQGFAQAIIKEVKEQDPLRTTTYSFPKVILPNKAIATKINNDLMHDFLDIEPGKVKKSIFEKVWGANGTIPSLIDVGYKTIRNTSKLLCMELYGEGCGAYCEGFTHYYTYDLTTGARLKLEQILSVAGQKLVLDSVKARKANEIRNHIAAIKDSLTNPSVLNRQDDKEYYTEALDMYEACQTSTYEPELPYMKFYVTDKELHVILERCSAHVNRALDELYEFDFVFDLKKIDVMLTKEFKTRL